MTQRILISPTRVAVSRPGYDVVSPPAVTSDYLSVDSSFGKPLRLLQTGVVYGVSINGFGAVGFGTTYASFPQVLVLPFVPGAPSYIHNLFQKWIAGSQNYYFQPYNVTVTKSQFSVGRSDGYNGFYDDGYYNTARHWIYFVLPIL